MTHATKSFGSSAMAFMVGIGAGAAAGLLLAPHSGQETRAKLKEKAIKTRSKMQDEAAQQKGMLQGKARKVASAVTDNTQEQLEAGRHAAETLQQKTRQASDRLAGEATGNSR